MKVRIKKFRDKLPEYLTLGKVYEVESISQTGFLFWAISDDGEKNCFLFDRCAHLNGGSWEVVE